MNFANLGGIAIGGILSEQEAVSRLRLNSEYMNTYAVLGSDAFTVAFAAGLGAIYQGAHINYNDLVPKILNKPHYHPILDGGIQSHSHSFFGL